MKKLALLALFAFSVPVFGMETQITTRNMLSTFCRKEEDVAFARAFIETNRLEGVKAYVFKVDRYKNRCMVAQSDPLWFDEVLFGSTSSAAAPESHVNFGAGLATGMRKAFGGSKK